MDPLSEVLSVLRFKDSGFVCTQASEPWGFSLPESRSRVRFHYVPRGSCWLEAGGSSTPVALGGGDLVVLAQGDAHTLRDKPTSPVSDMDAMVRARGPQATGADAFHEPVHLDIGGEGATTTIVSGSFEFEDLPETPVLASLPPVIRVAGDSGPGLPSFEQNLRFMAREVESKRPGAQFVLTRMVDVVFVQVLRGYIEGLPDGAEGFLGALRDPGVSAALALIHRQPGEQWTVGSLAAKVGVSRSTFAAKFAHLVGEPPLGYLTRVRMQKATMLLREGATLSKASQVTGYASEASFSYAFRQWAGVAPGAYRKQHRAVTTPDRPAVAGAIHSAQRATSEW
jgi:AraC-like DNA-binding protein